MSLPHDAVVTIIGAVVEALAKVAPAAIAALRGKTLDEILAQGRAVLPAAGAARGAVDAIFAEHPIPPVLDAPVGPWTEPSDPND